MPNASRRWFQAWFGLTRGEQRALVIVGAMFVLGVAVRCWRFLRGAG